MSEIFDQDCEKIQFAKEILSNMSLLTGIISNFSSYSSTCTKLSDRLADFTTLGYSSNIGHLEFAPEAAVENTASTKVDQNVRSLLRLKIAEVILIPFTLIIYEQWTNLALCCKCG